MNKYLIETENLKRIKECRYNDAVFMVCPSHDTDELEELFRYGVFKMLKAEGKITNVVIENIMNWH